MKKLMLIGKINKIAEELNALLSRDFRVQIVPDDNKILPGIIKIKEPDLIILNLVGIYEPDGAIFFTLINEFPHIPVLTVGTGDEVERTKRFFNGPAFDNVLRPVTYSSIIKAISNKLGLSPDYFGEAETWKKRVLVVDDNGALLRTIKEMLEERYDVSIATSGMKAMTSIGKKRPDIILLDYDMPVCDGKQTLEMIRADEELRNMPVIFLTGYNDRAHIEQVLQLNPQGYLLKPPVKDNLLQTIESVIGK